MTSWLVEVSGLLEPGSATTAIAILLAIFWAAVVAVFVRHVGKVLRAVLDEHDPVRQRILRDVLRDLLEPFCPREAPMNSPPSQSLSTGDVQPDKPD